MRIPRGVLRPELLTTLLCALLLALDVRGPDLPAQEYRAWLVAQHGIFLWNGHWYDGHLLPGYSLLFPPLAALVGVRLLIAVCCILSTALVSRLAGPSTAGRVAAWWFAAATVSDLAVGRGPFALGLVLGLAAIVALRADRPVWVAVSALACSLASPLAGAFLLLVGAAMTATWSLRRLAPLAAALGGMAAASALGGAGVFPFPLATFIGLTSCVLIGLAVVPRENAVVRRGLLLYGVAGVVLFVVPNPVGGNVARLGTLCAGPLAAAVLLDRRRRRGLALGLVTAPLLWWHAMPLASAVAIQHDASADISYYQPVLDYLDAQGPWEGRLEIPFTRNHWEADFVAARYPLARGWDRQLDLQHNAVLYAPLTAEGYRSWVERNAVAYIALPDAPLDPSGANESRLLLHTNLPWLQPVWHSAHWRVWRVVGSPRLASGPVTSVRLGLDSIRLTFTGPGSAVLRVRWNPFWSADDGVALAPTDDGWTLVTSTRAGTVELRTTWKLSGIFAGLR